MMKTATLGLVCATLVLAACQGRPHPQPPPSSPAEAACVARAPTGKRIDAQGREPPSPESVVGLELAGMNERIAAVGAHVQGATRSVVVEGEDATSAFATVKFRAADGTLLKLRWVWNGGCCSAPEVHEFVFSGADLMEERFLVAPRDDANALMNGGDAERAILLDQLWFRNGRMVLWAERQGRHYVSPDSDRDRWIARETITVELVSALRGGDDN